MMKKIFNIPTLFILSGLIALFLMPGDMLNAKTRAQLIKEAEAALAKAKRTLSTTSAKARPATRLYGQSVAAYNALKAKLDRAKAKLDKDRALHLKYWNELKILRKAVKDAEAALARAKSAPVTSGQPAAGTWKKLPGAGLDISVGAKGDAWCVGMDQAPYKWNGRAWQKYPGGIVRIDVDPWGRPWAVNRADYIYLMDIKTKKWHLLPGRAKDIGNGGPGPGVTWVIGTNKEAGGYGIYRWTGKTWIKVPGSALRIDVDKSGRPWVVNKNKDIFGYDGKAFRHYPGKAIDIACGPDGSVWILGIDKIVYKFNGKTWTKGNGAGYHITVDNRGLPWVIGTDKATWMRTK
ncbi:tectonin domain-containing protein [Candidatus Riflebacteria bacterium]